ncbi:hypothetical protein SAMN04488688_10884 [Paenibacillus sp. cl141a]|nr:hypothetical protein SAMN04488688_10884 [Paenibacillus sp. cl141a]
MILIMKRFAFWFCLLSLLICFFNFSGNDDKNLLIFLTNPINLLLVEWLTDINTNPDTSKFFQPLIYLFHLLFWIVLGFVIDLLIKSIKKHKIDLRSK